MSETKPDPIRKGNLEYRAKRGGNGWQFCPVLLRCPACGYVFEDGCSRRSHISGHSPKDFGL